MLTAAIILRSSNPAGLLIWCVIGFCTGIGLFYCGFRLLQRRRLILDTPFSKIRSAAMGMVEINGLAVGPYTMIAPITARPCYYYRTLVWEWKQSGKNKQWVKVAAECMHVPFFVDDNTGRLLVDPRGADLDLHRDFQQEFNGSFFSNLDTAPGNVNSFLARHGVVTGNKIKVEEFCIKPKNALFILGTLAENPGVEVTPRPIQDAESINSFAPQGFSLGISTKRMFSTGSPDNQILVQREARPHEVVRLPSGSVPATTADMTQQQKVAAALLKAGISNPAAWAAAGVQSAGGASTGVQVAADRSSMAENGSLTTDGFDVRPPVILMKGAHDKTFLISWRSQREVVQSLGWKSALMIWGGPCLAILSLYLLLNIKGLFLPSDAGASPRARAHHASNSAARRAPQPDSPRLVQSDP